MQVFQTAGVPPRRGRIILAIISATRKSRPALRKSVRENRAGNDANRNRPGTRSKSLFEESRFLEFADLGVAIAEFAEDLPGVRPCGAAGRPVLRRGGRVADRVAELLHLPAPREFHPHPELPRPYRQV